MDVRDGLGMLDAGDALVRWRGPSPQIVTNPLGREVVASLGTVPLTDLAEDLQAIGLGEVEGLQAALAGLLQLLVAEGVEVGASADPSHAVDTATAARLFLARWDASGRGAAAVEHGEGADVTAAEAAHRVLVSVGGTHRCVASGRAATTARAEAELVARASTEGQPVVSAFRHGDLTTVTPLSGAAGSLDVRAHVGGEPAQACTGRLDGGWRHVELADGTVVPVDSIRVPLQDGAELELAPPRGGAVGWSARRADVLDPSRRVVLTHALVAEAPCVDRLAASFRASAGELLHGVPSSRSVKVAPGRCSMDRTLWALGPAALRTLDATSWQQLLERLDAPPALVSAGLDPGGAQEALIGYEVDGGRVTHKLYVVGAGAAQYDRVTALLGLEPSPEGPPTFLSLKWEPGVDDRWWSAEYRPPAPGRTAWSCIEDAFTLPAGRPWRHALVQLAAPQVVGGAMGDGAPPGWPATMHAANLLVMRDSRGRRSVDLRARRVERPDELWPVLSWLADVAGLSSGDEAQLLAFGSGGPVERAIGGTTGDGAPFVSLYRASSVEEAG